MEQVDRKKFLDKKDVIELRKEFISPSFTLHYSTVHPLKIVYGKGQLLYDENDQPYLDCINNVTQVGHCHPRVVEAVSSQMARLDSTPFPISSHCSSHLLSYFPPSLNHVFYTTSGSEANDLALSICEVVTGGTEVLVLDGAYHGHTRPLLGLSSYKIRQQVEPVIKPNCNSWLCSLPDTYRGKYRGTDAGTKYANEVGEIISTIGSKGKKVSCFMAESFPSCAGQVRLPDGYFSAVFKLIHAAGGLCVVDEIQTGFGRAGEYFWMYESQRVCPDVVTVGKPMGNGHPVSAVITSCDIAKKYLETIGSAHIAEYWGDPVSLAAVDAVLSVIEDEKLQENAKLVGDYILQQLKGLMEKHLCIGDVRGLGLFIGMELVKDRESREPDPHLSKELVHCMLLEHQILINRDGLDLNVIKLKPPLTFNFKDAERLCIALDKSFTKITSGKCYPIL